MVVGSYSKGYDAERTFRVTIFNAQGLLCQPVTPNDSNVESSSSRLSFEKLMKKHSEHLMVQWDALQMDTEGLYAVSDIDEVRAVIFGISGDSTPGPDGFSSLFFQHCWDLVASDVVGAVADFFSGSHMPRSFTTMTIVLLPKKERPGLQQGDHLSPSLFVLATDYLSRTLDRLICGDTDMVFKTIKWGFPVSGQLVNRKKSSFYITEKFALTWQQQIQSVCGYQRGALPFTYLGIPIYRGALKASIFLPLRQRLSARIHGWSHRHLSFGGRLSLIKSTLATLPLHIFQVMDPPQEVLHQLEQMIVRFFWGLVGEQRKMHWISWETICLPVSEGGLGIRRFEDLITAFSWKLWWRFRARDSLWARYMRQKYCGLSHPERVPLRKSDTRVWRRLVRVGMQAQEHIRWTLGVSEVSFWDDVWYDDFPLSAFCPATVFDHMSVDWYFDGESWSMPRLMRWNLTSTGEFSLTSVWDQIRVPVDVCLQSRRTHLTSRCHCCDDPHVESLEHRNCRKHRGDPFLVSHIVWQVQRHLRLLVSAGKLIHQHWLGCYPQVPFMPVSDPVPRSLQSRMVSWRPPEALWVKFNTDGSYSTDLQMAAGGGGMVRDYTGSLLAGFCVPLRAASSFDAEFQALLHGLRLAMQYSDHIWIEMDAASLVSVLQSGRSGSAITRHTLTSIRMLCRRRHVWFSHIHREGNRAADFLTGRGLRPLRSPSMI
ncbi:hypothetical protein C2S52_018451 [Perilla frutescens var. hirtella]|nr:hypothetical protein C2S52_018451 [Perilla frutescens var. hirtella]